jgi:hypothetical protein
MDDHRYGLIPAIMGPIASAIAAAAWWFMCAKSLNTATWSDGKQSTYTPFHQYQ